MVIPRNNPKRVYMHGSKQCCLPNEPEVDENGLETPWEHPHVVTGFLEYFNSSEMQEEFSSIRLMKHTHKL
jgi:hypothetical protein